ncbi:hypothetical protein CEUSTIGMA_g9345.t1 [Chlamydomonas eustigma]|uniref:30S ribosomal protein S17, chloroplastic n=1 Tax=Chlamydomonas eustigma TaxID=1157962 RepID=A0A250XFS4_9CHLO|nr:hypothetical protein CEUSTIGMA_g9345.t1 [Chlamydomonas eustigma]|eukprot:GAX81917.1 hypothetical protein CEUSTIGMA_g9345.t1 [Chlamydomonas eustigma]
MGGSVFVGRVVSNRMQKTAVVAVHYAIWVPKYKVYQKRVSRHQAHDEKQACVVGDIVRIQATRNLPTFRRLSKHKSYKITDIIRRTSVYDPLEAARIAADHDASRRKQQTLGPGGAAAAAAAGEEGAAVGEGGRAGAPSALEVARFKVEETAQRLQALRNMYLKEMGGTSGAAAAANISGSSTATKSTTGSLLQKGFGLKPRPAAPSSSSST